MAGRRPKPTALKQLQGTLRKDRTNANEPKPEALSKGIPKHLSKEARKYWQESFKLLDGAGILAVTDTDSLALYCETKARWIHAKKRLEKDGLVIKAQSGFPVQNPYLQIMNKSHEQMMKLIVEFGMTPAARTKVNATPKDDEEPNPFDFIGDSNAMDALRRKNMEERKKRGKPNPWDSI